MGRAQSPIVPKGRSVVWPKADEWCGRSATSRRNRPAKACRVWISAEDVAVAEQRVGEDRSPQQRWGGRGATARRNRIAKACRVEISAGDVAVAEQRVGEDRSPQQGIVAVTSRRIEDVAVAENKRGGRLNLCSRRRCVKSLAYTASKVVGRDGSSPEPNHARRPMSGVAEVQLLEGIVSRRLVASGYPPKILLWPKRGG
jgi:hypothetical protein